MSQTQQNLTSLDQLDPSKFQEIQGQPLPTAPAQTQPAPAQEQPAPAAQAPTAPLPNIQPIAAPVAQPAQPGFFQKVFNLENGTLYTPAGVAVAAGVGIAVGVGATLLCQALFGGSPTEA